MSARETREVRAARLYDWEHDDYREDLDVLVALARRSGGPVLEVACGSGRVLDALVAAGLACTGVDVSSAMLARATRRLAHAEPAVRLVEQPMQALELGSAFRTILVVLDSFGLLETREDRLATLAECRRHVSYDGRLILDVSNGNLRGANESADELIHHLTADDPATGHSITKWVVRQTDVSEQRDDLLMLYDETDADGRIRRTTVRLALYWYGRNELELLLERAGWRVAELYGDYDLSSFSSTSPRLLIVAAPS